MTRRLQLPSNTKRELRKMKYEKWRFKAYPIIFKKTSELSEEIVWVQQLNVELKLIHTIDVFTLTSRH